MKLVEQLRCRAKADTAPKGLSYENHIDWMAADRIEALEAALREARGALNWEITRMEAGGIAVTREAYQAIAKIDAVLGEIK